MSDFTFDLLMIDGFRGIPHLDKIEALRNAIAGGEVAVSVDYPSDVFKEHGIVTGMKRLSSTYHFKVIKFDEDDMTLTLEPLTQEAFNVNPKIHQCHVAYLTSDQVVDGLVYSNINGVMCIYFTNKVEEQERIDKLERDGNPSMGGQIHAI